jgi:hypothetical protein
VISATETISVSNARALENVRARMWKIRAGGGPVNAVVRSTLASLQQEPAIYEQELDAALIARWERTMSAHMRARREAARTNAELAEMAPHYKPAVLRAQARHDQEVQL